MTNPLTLNAGLAFSGGTITNGILNVAGTSTHSAVMGAAGLTLNNSGTYNLTLASGNLFSGAGTVFNNSGTIVRSGGTGVVSFNMPLNNSGTVSVASGTLQLTAGGSGAGIFSADAGTILRLSSGYTFNSGASWAGAGTIEVANGIDAHIGGTIQNSGTFALAATNILTRLVLDADSTLTGGGTLTLASFNSQSNARLGGIFLLNNVDNLIQGEGNLGLNETQFINQAAGVVNANVNGRVLTVDPGANGFANQGLLAASNGGVLLLTGNGGGDFSNSGGIIRANGGEVQLSSLGCDQRRDSAEPQRRADPDSK